MFELENKQYTLVLAEGVATDSGISKHTENPLQSTSTVSLSSNTYATFNPGDDDSYSHEHDEDDRYANVCSKWRKLTST